MIEESLRSSGCLSTGRRQEGHPLCTSCLSWNVFYLHPSLLFLYHRPFSSLRRKWWDGGKKDAWRGRVKVEPANPGSPGKMTVEPVCVSVYYTLTLMYSWPSRYHQWWKCKFLGEGIEDQGGGFRDSLSDVAEELCPSSSDCPVPLPFFIRTPNQVTVNSLSDPYVHLNYCLLYTSPSPRD